MTRPDPTRQDFKPYADAASVRTVGALMFENGPDAIALHGSLDLTRDAAGLVQARALKATVDAIVAALEAADLPIAIAESTAESPNVKNPFA